MKGRFSPGDLLEKFDSRTLRERAVLLICLLVVLFFLFDLLVLESIDQQKKADQAEVDRLKVSLVELFAREQVAKSRQGVDPDFPNQQKLTALQQQIGELHAQLEENVASLISPQEMPGLLKDLLQWQQKLRLISLENLPPEKLSVGSQGDETQPAPDLYRHRLQMEFSGDYLAILKYLRTLEGLPRSMVWEKLQIETQEYPVARVRLQVYTLSLSEGWIGG